MRRKHPDEDALEQLRRLDRKAKGASTAVSLTLGIVGILVFGTGMSICLVGNQYLPGVLVGILGILLMGAAYPAKRILEKKEKKIRPEDPGTQQRSSGKQTINLRFLAERRQK